MKIYLVTFDCIHKGVSEAVVCSNLFKAMEVVSEKARKEHQEYIEMWYGWGEDAPQKYEDFAIWNDNERTLTMESEQKIIRISEKLLDGEWTE